MTGGLEYIIVLLVQILILFYLSDYLKNRTARCTIGRSMYLFYALAFVGTVIHEASHAIAVILCGGKLREVKLFKPNRRNGTLGYVTYNKTNYVAAMFIGLAPLVGNTLALMFFARYFAGVGGSGVVFGNVASAGSVILDFFHIFANGLFMLAELDYAKTGTWLFLYLALSTGTGVAPSVQDVKTALPGIAVMGIFWALVLYVDSTYTIGDVIMPSLVGVFAAATTLFTFGIMVNGIMCVILAVVCKLVGK